MTVRAYSRLYVDALRLHIYACSHTQRPLIQRTYGVVGAEHTIEECRRAIAYLAA